MNCKEFWDLAHKNKHFVSWDYFNATKTYLKSNKFCNELNIDVDATDIHHLRDTEEQRKYNDEHYELWGHNLDGTFEYGKYVVFWTHEHHIKYHILSEETRRKLSDSLKMFYSTNEGKLNAKLRMTDAVKQKISASVKATMTEEHRCLLSDIAKKNMTDERKELIRQATKEAMSKSEIRQKISNSKLGKPLSEEHKKAISEGSKGREVSKETREKISKIHKGKIVSDETRMKLSESHKNQIPWNKGKRISEDGYTPWNKGKKLSDEQKAKLRHKKSDSHKESLKKSMEKRTSAYYEYKEQHPDTKWVCFLQNIWPGIKGSHAE